VKQCQALFFEILVKQIMRGSSKDFIDERLARVVAGLDPQKWKDPIKL
jgi:hypothetical protein